MMDLKELSLKLHPVSVFRQLLSDDVIKRLTEYLDLPSDADNIKKADAYSAFVSALYEHGGSLSNYIKRLVNESENIYVKSVGGKRDIPKVLEESLIRDLKTFNLIAGLSPSDIYRGDDSPCWITEECDIEKDYLKRVRSIGKYGYGIYAKYHMFYISESGEIVPVMNPDKTTLSDLIDYEREQKIIMDNTCALLLGRPAGIIGVTGAAGAG